MGNSLGKLLMCAYYKPVGILILDTVVADCGIRLIRIICDTNNPDAEYGAEYPSMLMLQQLKCTANRTGDEI